MKPKRMTPEMLEQAQRADRIKLIVMGLGVVMIGIALIFSQQQVARLASEGTEALPTDSSERGESEEPVAEGRVPAFDMLEVLDPVRDAEPSQRVIVDPRALDVVFDYGRILTANQYEAIGVQELNPANYDALWESPSEQRVKPFRMRGEVTSLKRRKRAERRPDEYAGTLRLEDGRYGHFVVLEKAEGLAEGDWARVDGMFLKLYSTEASAGDGRWEGPLLCGAELQRSYAPIVPAGAMPTTALAKVTDDELDNITGLPEDALWELLALAASPDPGTDWENAPALEGQLMGEILADGASFRGQPIRVDLSKNLDAWTEKAGENPLRLERITKGWIGNQTWKGQVPVIYFISPTDQGDLSDRYGLARYVEGRGYFFKNYAYEKADGDLGRVPVFVMDTIAAVQVAEDPTPRRIMWAMLGVSLGMIGLLAYLLLRDRRKSAELQAELVRRRRARRAGVGSQGPKASGDGATATS